MRGGRSTLPLAVLALMAACGHADAEPVTPWGVARTILPDAPSAPDAVGPPLVPAMPGGGIGAVLGPGSAPRTGGSGLHSAAPSALPRPRLTEMPPEPVPPELNPLAAMLPPLKAIRERPLFSPSRRPRGLRLPPSCRSCPGRGPPPTAPTLRLIGIVQDPESAAGVVRQGNGPTRVVRAGDPVEGWSVSEIGPEHLTLRLGDQVQTYRLFAATPPGPRPRPTPRQASDDPHVPRPLSATAGGFRPGGHRVAWHGPACALLLLIGLALVAAQIAWQDLVTFTISDLAVLALGVLGLAARFTEEALSGFPLLTILGLALLDGLLCGAAFLLVREGFYRWRGFDGLGFGDVKLALAGGILVGTEGFAWTVLAASLGGLTIALWLRARHEPAPETGQARLRGAPGTVPVASLAA